MLSRQLVWFLRKRRDVLFLRLQRNGDAFLLLEDQRGVHHWYRLHRVPLLTDGGEGLLALPVDASTRTRPASARVARRASTGLG